MKDIFPSWKRKQNAGQKECDKMPGKHRKKRVSGVKNHEIAGNN
ncbi:MAG: hypothetical protein SOV46_06700 [Candidatus Faecousia sp.]|nr:hypothetical protein [Candidatus Faecousia sp.]